MYKTLGCKSSEEESISGAGGTTTTTSTTTTSTTTTAAPSGYPTPGVVDITAVVKQWPDDQKRKLATMFKATSEKVFEKSVEQWTNTTLPDGTSLSDFALSGPAYFVRVGDLPHMLLRDSTCSFHHLLVLPPQDDKAHMLAGFTNLITEMMIQDPRCPAWNNNNFTCQNLGFTYEQDSPAYVLRWLRMISQRPHYWNAVTQGTKTRIPQAVESIINMFQEDLDAASKLDGVTLLKTEHRSSDMYAKLPYNIADNLFAAAELKFVSKGAIPGLSEDLQKQAGEMACSIVNASNTYGVSEEDGIYCYEVGGQSWKSGKKCVKQDDANMPSLVSIPYFDVGADLFNRSIYEKTRSEMWSSANPFFFSGKYASGLGTDHFDFTGKNVWPMSLLAKALTSTDQSGNESADLLLQLIHTDDGTNLMHESFDPDDPSIYTRAWFDWPNALFAEFVFSSVDADLLKL